MVQYLRQKYIRQLSDRSNNGLIKIITGSRRAGKSYLLNELYYNFLRKRGVSESKIIRFAFDMDEDIDRLDEFFPNLETKIKQKNNTYTINSKKFRAYIEKITSEQGNYFLILDEVQLLDNFVGTLNGFLRHKNFDIYVTGSNSKFLSSDIATEFKGRGTIIHVLPLTFSEYIYESNKSLQESWKDYIETGGLPIIAQMKTKEEQVSYLKMLCEETYLKDIIARNGVRKGQELSDVFDIIASTIGAPVNSLKIANTFKSVMKKNISDETIAKFISYFEDAFLISKVKRYNIKGRKYIGSLYKLYFEDIGVRNARLNFKQIEETHITENIIYNELRYRGFRVDVGEVDVSEKTNKVDKNGANIYTQKQLEVDFIAEAGNQKYYIQSALSMSNVEKELHEKKSLNKIDDSFQKIIITKNGLNLLRDENGIITMDLFDFLTNDQVIII